MRPWLRDILSARSFALVQACAILAGRCWLRACWLPASRRRKSVWSWISVRATAAHAPELLRAELVGGDVVYGAIAGGDEDGDQLEWLSPILGKVALPIDRLAAIVQPGVHASDQMLPKDVDEGIYLRTGRGYDLVAGTLHRFGNRGISFQAIAAEAPQWFSPRKFSSLRLRGALAMDGRGMPQF